MGNHALRCCIQKKMAEDPAEDAGGLATNKVELATSELFSVPGLAVAYHTSVLVNGEEFFFSDSGIFTDRALTSHQGKPSELLEMGYSTKTGIYLLRTLSSRFAPGSYDLIYKNCNSFSDCALYYLVRKRLPSKYTALERLGKRASPDLLKRVTKGMYQTNQASESFRVEELCAWIDRAGDDEPQDVGGVGAGLPRSRAALSIGALVTIVGLKQAETLNGLGAQIVRFNGINGRWEARINATGEVKALRAENLRPAGELVLEPGSVVRIHGLKSGAGQHLNGKDCVVQRYLHDLSRYEVKIDGETKALKGENLQQR